MHPVGFEPTAINLEGCIHIRTQYLAGEEQFNDRQGAS